MFVKVKSDFTLRVIVVTVLITTVTPGFIFSFRGTRGHICSLSHPETVLIRSYGPEAYDL